MIDYVKALGISVNANSIIQNEPLNFATSFDEKTGEIHNAKSKIAEYKNLYFALRGDDLKITGSLHKYKNEGIHNYDDFTYLEVCRIIDNISTLIEVEPERINLNNLEFGVNLSLSFNPSLFLDDLLTHRSKSFNTVKNSKMHYCQVEHAAYRVKIYNKGLQYDKGDVIRIELKYNKMRPLNSKGINSLADLQSLETWETMQRLLIDEFNQVIHVNSSIEINQLNDKDRVFLEKVDNPKYWTGDEPRHKKLRSKKKLEQIISQYSKVNYPTSDSIKNKVDELKSVTFAPHCNNSKSVTFTPPDSSRPKQENVTFTHFSYSVQSLHPIIDEVKPCRIWLKKHEYLNGDKKRVCPVTNIDVSMQKKSSRLLSNVGLKWLKDNQPETYDKIKRTYLPRSGYSGQRTKFESDEVNHIAKQIRNTYYNKRRKPHQLKKIR